MATAFARSQDTTEYHQRVLTWDTIVELSSKHFELVPQVTGTVVRILCAGTFQLNLNVTHENTTKLVVVINSASEEVEFLPTTLQRSENKKCTSRVDRQVVCNVNDHIMVELRPQSSLNTATASVMWLSVFEPLPNTWLFTFIDKQLLTIDKEDISS